MVTQPPINAFDLDTGINARLRYSIVSGNEAGFFEMHDQTGELFLVREIDLETLPAAVLSLQLQVSLQCLFSIHISSLFICFLHLFSSSISVFGSEKED